MCARAAGQRGEARLYLGEWHLHPAGRGEPNGPRTLASCAHAGMKTGTFADRRDRQSYLAQVREIAMRAIRRRPHVGFISATDKGRDRLKFCSRSKGQPGAGRARSDAMISMSRERCVDDFTMRRARIFKISTNRCCSANPRDAPEKDGSPPMN